MNTSKPPVPIACTVVGSAVDAATRSMAEGKDEMHGEKKTSASGDVTYNTGTSHLHMTDEFKDKKKRGSARANSEVRNPQLCEAFSWSLLGFGLQRLSRGGSIPSLIGLKRRVSS